MMKILLQLILSMMSIFNNDDSDYKNLLTRLKEISETITLLEKQYFK